MTTLLALIGLIALGPIACIVGIFIGVHYAGTKFKKALDTLPPDLKSALVAALNKSL